MHDAGTTTSWRDTREIQTRRFPSSLSTSPTLTTPSPAPTYRTDSFTLHRKNNWNLTDTAKLLDSGRPIIVLAARAGQVERTDRFELKARPLLAVFCGADAQGRVGQVQVRGVKRENRKEGKEKGKSRRRWTTCGTRCRRLCDKTLAMDSLSDN